MSEISWNIEIYDDLSSTQDVVKEAASEGADEGFVAQALEQSSGHGRHGREWVSPKGNLYISFLLRPMCSGAEVGQISLLVALALQSTIEDCGVHTQLKWPNDVLIDGKKCAGILLETELSSDGHVEWIAIGCGVNVIEAPQGTSIVEHASGTIDLDAFRDTFLAHFGRYYQQWGSEGFAALRDLWLSKAHPKDSAMSVKVGEQLENGFFHDIDARGNLRLRLDNGEIKTITAGDVYLFED